MTTTVVSLLSLLFSLPVSIFYGIMGITAYVTGGLALFELAQRRNFDNAWFAWIPVLNHFLRGKIADDIVEKKSGKKTPFALWILILSIATLACSVISIVAPCLALVLLIVVIPAGIANTVLKLVCAHKIYKVYRPNQAVLFTILGSVFFNLPLTEIFLLCCKSQPEHGEEYDTVDFESEDYSELA